LNYISNFGGIDGTLEEFAWLDLSMVVSGRFAP